MPRKAKDVTVLAYYNGNVYDMDYVSDPKQRYQFAYYRITDNGFSGYILEGTRLYKITKYGNRNGKLLSPGDEERERVMAEMAALPVIVK